MMFHVLDSNGILLMWASTNETKMFMCSQEVEAKYLDVKDQLSSLALFFPLSLIENITE